MTKSLSESLANSVARLLFIASFYGLLVMILMPFGFSPIAWSIWYDFLIVFIGVIVYTMIFRLTGLEIHITNRHGVIKWTIKGGL